MFKRFMNHCKRVVYIMYVIFIYNFYYNYNFDRNLNDKITLSGIV